MTKETRSDPRRNFVPRLLPWLLAILMLGIYCLTLNRWMSLANMLFVARASGWIWSPELVNPLVYLATYPLHWLGMGLVPVAMDLMSAACAALTLGLLARTVALLPQDRTEAQRVREHSDFSFLTTPMAWLPQVLAVVVCGLQFTFWKHATNFTGESLDLLVFAFTVWALAEYRLDEHEGRLMAAMFLYGADMSENFAMIGFFPILVVALIWIRGLGFFNLRFLMRLLRWGLGGACLYFLLPTLAVLSGRMPRGLWWQMLKINLSSQIHVFRYFFANTEARHSLYLISLITLLPVGFMAVRWSAAFGDRSKLGTAMTNLMIHVICGVLLFISVWVSFDPPFSPRHLGEGLPFLSFLTFYYLSAMSVGYYSGYFLLIARPVVSRSARRRKVPAKMSIWYPVAIGAVLVLTALTVTGLIYKNGPAIRNLNSGILRNYARLATASLPRTGGILLSDNESGGADVPGRLYLVEEELAQEGRAKEYVPVDTFSLNKPEYHRYLHRNYPDRWPLLVGETNQNYLNPQGLLSLMNLLSQTNSIYYLHPSFGYYFEVFYAEPHGLVYRLEHLPADTLRPPAVNASLIAENEAFWTRAETEDFDPILGELAAENSPPVVRDFSHRIMKRLHVTPEPNVNALTAASYYARDLDFWGVELQRAKRLPQAQAAFETTLKLNPQSTPATINLQFNHELQKGAQVPMDLSKTTPDHFGQYRSWDQMKNAGGPIDEPSFCYQDGSIYLQGALLNQAIAAFARVRELEPDYLPARLSLGTVYVLAHRPGLAVEALEEPLADPRRFSLEPTNSTELNVVAAAAFIQNTNLARGVGLLEKEISYHPDDLNLLRAATQVYFTQGLYTNALRVIKLQLATNPDDPTWLYGLGYAYLLLNESDRAIAPLSRVIALEPDNHEAVFKRALAYLNTGKLNAARSDYKSLQLLRPQSYPVAYGLGEIAWRQHATNEALQNYSLYVASAPTNSLEFKEVSARLAELKGAVH